MKNKPAKCKAPGGGSTYFPTKSSEDKMNKAAVKSFASLLGDDDDAPQPAKKQPPKGLMDDDDDSPPAAPTWDMPPERIFTEHAKLGKVEIIHPVVGFTCTTVPEGKVIAIALRDLRITPELEAYLEQVNLTGALPAK